MLKKLKQEGFKDCGPTCLYKIIKYYKGYININELKELCKTNKNGTDAYHLIEASKKCGFTSYGIRCKLEDFDKNIILPCIAHVIINNSYNHYVVIEKIKNKKLLIYDPIGKTKYYKLEEFKKIYNNILIILYPNKVIKNTPYNSFNKFILKVIDSSKRQIFESIVLSIFITSFSIITSFYMQNMIDNIYSKSKVILIFIIFLFLYLLKIFSDFCRNKILILVNQKVDLNLTYDTFKHIINLPYCYYKNNTTGEIISKINDLESVRSVISKSIITLFIDLPLTFLSCIVMYFISNKLLFISLIILILYLLNMYMFKKLLNDNIDNCIESKTELFSFMTESINGYETIKGCNDTFNCLNKFENKYCKLSNNLFKLDNIINYQILLKDLINNLGFIFLILSGILLVINKEITIGKLLSFNTLSIYFLNPIRNVIDLNNDIKEAKIAIKKILNLYYKKVDKGIIKNKLKGDIIFNNLSYSYNDERLILKNINLTIKEKSKVMVIGSSGSGKSTLFKLLKKYYSINRDKIFINNIDINDYETNDIVYVSQNETLFTDTIYNTINSNNIINISKICLIDEIIKNNNLGFNMVIEENGFNLSGGQRQRIILGRALAKDFSVLIIDEGLNQVDVNMERIILKNILKNYNDKTIIYISHRLENMDLFNQLIKLEKGRLCDISKNN